MLKYPHFDPIAFSIGPLHVHWYGLMYLCGFACAYLLARYRMHKQPCSPIATNDHLLDLLFYAAIGVVVGGRCGYMLFYDLSNFLSHPWIIFEVWDGGMSFHGGLIGVIIAMYFFSRRIKASFLGLTDFIAPIAPIGLGLGRLGNFINGELWGRVTNSPIGMVFPTGGPLPRYPSQLFELALEGVTLFVIMWLFSLKQRSAGMISGLFLILYACFRFFVEFYREPDPQLGYLAFGWLTMGQVLCVPMFFIGIFLIWRANHYAKPT